MSEVRIWFYDWTAQLQTLLGIKFLATQSERQLRTNMCGRWMFDRSKDLDCLPFPQPTKDMQMSTTAIVPSRKTQIRVLNHRVWTG
jgi:hypothetical protein